VSSEGLKIQLAEPVWNENDSWELPLDAALAADPPSAPSRKEFEIDPEDHAAPDPLPPGQDLVRIGGIAPWFFDGPRIRADWEPVTPLRLGSSRVGVRWLGRPEEWAQRPPAEDLRDSFLLSTFDPLSGKSLFLLAVNLTNRRLPSSHLGGWLAAALDSRRQWLALHAIGEMVIVGQDQWRLGETATTRAPMSGKIERAGVVLILDEVGPGELVDWARLTPASFSCSPTNPNLAPEEVISGRLWPTSVKPAVWMSATEGVRTGEPPCIEIRLQEERPVTEIRLAYAQAAGWSEHFNPGKVRLRFEERQRTNGTPMIELNEIAGPLSVIRLAAPRMLEAVKVEFIEPTQMNLPSAPARLAALQLLGPLDGPIP
jgi:hypothetical protein